MPLSTIRDRFIQFSGRYDLGTIGGADNGANQFINRAQEYLDSKVTVPSQFNRYQKDIAADEYLLDFTRCRSVSEVWVTDAEGRTRLEKQDFNQLRMQYPDPYGDIDTGTPAFYALRVLSLAPSQEDLETGDYDDEFTYEYEDLVLADEGNAYEYTGLLLMPPADATYTVTVFGRFYGNLLTNDADANWWTEMHPDALLYAALWKEQVSSRNREGANDWLEALGEELDGIEKDGIERDTSEMTKLQG